MADSLMKLGMKKALVVCSTVGKLSLDEMTPCGPTRVVEVTPAGTKAYSFNPRDVGIPECELSDLAGGDAKLNARMLTDALGGEKGPVADCLMLNAGVAMAAVGPPFPPILFPPHPFTFLPFPSHAFPCLTCGSAVTAV